MAGTLNVTCGKCGTKYQVPPVLAGKSIRCKNCSATIAVARAAAPATAKPVAKGKPVAAAKPAAPAAAPASSQSEEWGAISAYGVIKEKDNPRCPHCAHDMEEGEIVCLNCGYNTLTRERLPQRILEPVTGMDYFWWLLPGIAAFLFMLVNILFAQSIFTRVPEFEFLEWMYFHPLENKAIPVYMAIFFAFDIFGLGYFCVRRLILNPHPPEKEMHLENEKEED